MFWGASGATRIKTEYGNRAGRRHGALGGTTARCAERRVPNASLWKFDRLMFGRSLFFQPPGAFQIERNATMATISTVSSITTASPRPLFTGFPYLVTRLAPANYHFILLPGQEGPWRTARAGPLPSGFERSAIVPGSGRAALLLSRERLGGRAVRKNLPAVASSIPAALNP
jgi:hypothetical protein